jgi:hypothetical protein
MSIGTFRILLIPRGQIWIPWNAQSTCERSRSSRCISPNLTSASLQQTTPGPSDAMLNACIPSRPLLACTDFITTDRTLPGHLRVYTSTQSQSDEPSSKPMRVATDISINIGAGSDKAPGKIVARRQTSLDDAVKEPGKPRRASTLVTDAKFTIDDLVDKLDIPLMEEPVDEWPQPVCNGSCRHPMKALQIGNALGPTVVRLMSHSRCLMKLTFAIDSDRVCC